MNSIKDKKNSNFNLKSNTQSILYAQISNKETVCDVYIGNELRYHYKYALAGLADFSSINKLTSSPLYIFSIKKNISEYCSNLKDLYFSKIAILNPKIYSIGYNSKIFLQKKFDKKVSDKIIYGNNEYQVLSFLQNNNVLYAILPYNMIKGSKNISSCNIEGEESIFYSIYFNNENIDKSTQFIKFLQLNENKILFKSHGFY
ncbi:MAG: substrate-binding domain-containing protein [Succinivibrionaceae bacterium]